MKTRLGGRTWAALLTFGLFGQIAWVIENMYFNVFLYNTISGDTSMIAAMVAWSAVTATVTTLVMGALSDRLGRRKALIVIGYLLWGVSIGAFAFIKRSPLAGAAHGAAVLVVVMDCVMTFFGSTANDAAFNAWVTDVTVPENRGRVETVLAIMPLVAMLVVFGALDGLTQAGNWRLFFLIVGGITCLGGVLGCFFIREPDLPRGPGQLFCQHSVRLPSRRCPGQPAAVSVPGGSGRILHEPAGVYALPHYLYPAVPGHHGLYPPAGRGC